MRFLACLLAAGCLLAAPASAATLSSAPLPPATSVQVSVYDPSGLFTRVTLRDSSGHVGDWLPLAQYNDMFWTDSLTVFLATPSGVGADIPIQQRVQVSGLLAGVKLVPANRYPADPAVPGDAGYLDYVLLYSDDHYHIGLRQPLVATAVPEPATGSWLLAAGALSPFWRGRRR